MAPIACAATAFATCGTMAAAQSAPSALEAALRGTGGAGMVLDVQSGRVLGSVGAVDRMSAPGSAVKPFVLRSALEDGVVTERTTVHCAGTLRIAGRNLACVHPRDVTVLDARQALAESCNTYFAAVARRFAPEQMAEALRRSGFAVSQAPPPVDGRELMGLGLAGVKTSVRGLATAYRELALWMSTDDKRARTVRDGLVASVATGVAHAAYTEGRLVAGKTGTVDERGTGRSHGWFAGVVYASSGRPDRVLVVFTPNGNGRDAAVVARTALGVMR